jgi:hypothetical protein
MEALFIVLFGGAALAYGILAGRNRQRIWQDAVTLRGLEILRR